MRHTLLLAGVLLVCPAIARAQVTIDLRALDAVPSAPSPVTAPKPAPRPAPKPVAAPKTEAVSSAPVRPASPPLPTPPTTPAVAAPSATQAAVLTPPPATLPTAAPATVALAPIPAPPTPSAPTPPPAPTVSATAGTTATPENTGLQLVFKPAEADLSPDASAAVSRLVNAVPTGDTISYNVVAYATGRADDPSVARRTSLARGLAVRGALIADGVPSTRIYVRALGSSVGGSDGPTDRVDVTVMGLSGAAIPVKQ